jgi:hypothetical protein
MSHALAAMTLVEFAEVVALLTGASPGRRA